MGVRPHLMSIFGIDNFQHNSRECGHTMITDPRLKDRAIWDSEDFWEHRIPLPGSPEEDCLSWTSGEIEVFFLRLLLQEAPGSMHAKPLSDLLEWTPEYGNPAILGLKIAPTIYSHDTLYVLSACDERFRNDGYLVAESYDSSKLVRMNYFLTLCKQMKEQKGHLPAGPVKEMLKKYPQLRALMKCRRNHWNYAHYDFTEVFGWAHAAQYIFKQIGIQVAEKELKLMLVWNWG